jgi:hypothetical protein
MIYYMVKHEYDNTRIFRHGKFVTILVGGELLGALQYRTLLSDSSTVFEHGINKKGCFTQVDVSPDDTYWLYGCHRAWAEDIHEC